MVTEYFKSFNYFCVQIAPNVWKIYYDNEPNKLHYINNINGQYVCDCIKSHNFGCICRHAFKHSIVNDVRSCDYYRINVRWLINYEEQ